MPKDEDGPPKDQQGPPSAEAARAETRLKGHLGHLTAAEEKAFIDFKTLCIKGGYYKPATVATKASHDDGTLIRYLRARRFVPRDAYLQFKDTEIWRKENDLDALYEKIDINEYQESRDVYPQWTGRRDKRGIPVYLYEVGKLDSKKMQAYASAAATSKVKTTAPSSSRMLRLFALYENLTRFVMPLCTAVPGRPNPETPVDQSNNIVDISRVGLKQFWNLRAHMQDASQLATAHYPETLDRIFILGAPAFFPTVWGWIKKWFDPITTSKIFILSQSQILPTLATFIDMENIPRKYGGQLDFECGQPPNLDPQIRACLEINGDERDFLTAPTRWIDSGTEGEGEMTAIGVGSRNGRQRKDVMAVLHGLVIRVQSHARSIREALSRQATSNTIPIVTSTGPPPSQVTPNVTLPPQHHQIQQPPSTSIPSQPIVQPATATAKPTLPVAAKIQPTTITSSQPALANTNNYPTAAPAPYPVPQPTTSTTTSSPITTTSVPVAPTPTLQNGAPTAPAPAPGPVPTPTSTATANVASKDTPTPATTTTIPLTTAASTAQPGLERLQTEYKTPPADAGELKRLEAMEGR